MRALFVYGTPAGRRKRTGRGYMPRRRAIIVKGSNHVSSSPGAMTVFLSAREGSEEGFGGAAKTCLSSVQSRVGRVVGSREGGACITVGGKARSV